MKSPAVKPRNTRLHYILECLRLVADGNKSEPLNIIEIGCMFKEDEGLSTLGIVQFLAEKDLQARFVSIDLDPAHVASCRSLIEARDPTLAARVELICGSSLRTLPELIPEMGTVHFAFLDGSGHPGITLKEFELVSANLAEAGLCLVDDVAETKPTEFYSAKRSFGKGTLLYPLLVLSNYVQYKHALQSGTGEFSKRERPLGDDEEAAMFLAIEEGLGLLGSKDYRLLRGAGGQHGMLAYGSRDILPSIEALV